MDTNIIAATENPKKTINRVDLTGSVIHKYRPRPDVLTLTIAIGNRCIPHAEDPSGANYPNVVFFGDSAEKIDRNIVINDNDYPRVCIEARVSTSRKDGEDGKPRFFQNVVGKNIRRASTSMEAAIGKAGIGNHKMDPKNEVVLMGELTHIYVVPGQSRPKAVILTLRTYDNGRVNYPHVTCFGSNVKTAMELKEGDVVCATAYLETSYRDRDGKRTRYESVVATEIAKTDSLEDSE